MAFPITNFLKYAVLSVGLSASIAVSTAWAVPQTTTSAITPYGFSAYKDFKAMPYANPNAPKGGSMVKYEGSNFDSFNPFINKGMPIEGTNLVFESLTSGSPDEAFARYPLLADRVTRDLNDPSWIIYHLNPKAKFSDGSPVTAEDVVFTFNILKEKGHPAIQMYYSPIKSVTATDKLTVKFEFTSTDNFEIGLTVGEQSILSKKDWTSRSEKDQFDRVSLKPPIGSGAYIVDKVSVGKSVQYKRNPNYWGKDLLVNQGRYNFDTIKYMYYLEEEIAFQGFKVGEYTFREENKAKRWIKDYNELPAIKAGVMKKELLPDFKPVTMQALVLNLRKPQFQNRDVRLALNYAYDFEVMNAVLFGNLYQRLTSFFENSELSAVGKPTQQELDILKPYWHQLPKDVQLSILNNEQQPISDKTGYNRANLLKARELLLKAGYRYQNGILVDAKGKPFTFEIMIRQQSLERVLLPWVRSLKRLGITATVRTVDTSQYIERARAFNYDVVIDQFPQSLSPGGEQIGYWGTQSSQEQGSNNSAGIANPVIDAILKKMIAIKDRQTLIIYTKVLDRLLRANQYMIPMYGLPAERVVYWNQFSYPSRKPKYTIGEDYWWFDAKKSQAVQNFLKK